MGVMQHTDGMQVELPGGAGWRGLPGHVTMLQVMKQPHQRGILQVAVAGLQPGQQVRHGQAGGQMAAQRGLVHHVGQGYRFGSRQVLRKGNRLRPVVPGCRHDVAHFVSGLDFQAAAIAPDRQAAVSGRTGKHPVQPLLAYRLQQGGDGTGECVVLQRLLAQRQQDVCALLCHDPPEPAQFLGLIGHLPQLQPVRIQAALDGELLQRLVQRALGGLQMLVETAFRPRVHHAVHGFDILVVRLQDALVALAGRHVGVGTAGIFGQLLNGMPVLLQLQPDLPEQFGQLAGGPAHAVDVVPGNAVGQCFRGIADGGDTSLQDGGQAKLVLAGQATHEGEDMRIELQIIAARHGLQQRTVDHLAQKGTLLFGVQPGVAPCDAGTHLFGREDGKLT